MKTLKENHDVDIHWRSFELRPAGAPPIPDWYKQKVLAARPQFKETMREHFGVEINSGPWGINSHASLVGHKIAVEQGKGHEYHEATLQAYWLEGKSIEDHDVLADIADNIGLAPDAFRFALKNPGYEEQVMQDIMQAQMSGIDAVPALVFKEKYLFKGAGNYETLVMMLERVKEIEAEEASE